MQVEVLPVEKLIPYARNARTHSDEQVAQIAASIREFGFCNPVLVDAEDGIIAGHGRVLAARKLGMGEVPCIRLGHLTETQKRAYVLADNKLALNAGWDEEMLRFELGDLQADGFDLDLAGFSAEELDELFADANQAEGETDPDAVPEVRTETVSKLGDVWLLGKHRLMCGDSTDAGSVALLMNGEKAAIMQTDPPYGVDYVATKGAQDRWESIKNDELKDSQLQSFLEAVFKNAADMSLAKDAAWYLWHAHLTQGFFAAAAAAAADVLLHRQIIWVKPSLNLTRSGMYHWKHEPCFYGWVRGHQPPWYGPKNQTSVWEVGRDTGTVHPTQKPVDIWAPGLQNHTKPGQIAYEPFSGSGSQIIAAERAGRRCYAMELAEPYVDVAVRRWQEYTGKKAILESTGEPFPDGGE